MRLVLDAVRDILLFIEQNQEAEYDYNGVFDIKPLSAKYIIEELGDGKYYTKEEVGYAINLLFNEGIISGNPCTGKNNRIINLRITGISFKGHKLLDNIRSNTVWDKVKERAASLGVKGLDGLCEISKNTIEKIIEDSEIIPNLLRELR